MLFYFSHSHTHTHAYSKHAYNWFDYKIFGKICTKLSNFNLTRLRAECSRICILPRTRLHNGTLTSTIRVAGVFAARSLFTSRNNVFYCVCICIRFCSCAHLSRCQLLICVGVCRSFSISLIKCQLIRFYCQHVQPCINFSVIVVIAEVTLWLWFAYVCIFPLGTEEKRNYCTASSKKLIRNRWAFEIGRSCKSQRLLWDTLLQSI